VNIRRIFVDTGAWFAVQASDDAHHRRAAATLAALTDAGYVFVTSNLVIGETYTLLRYSSGHGAAWRFMDALRQSRRLERVFITEGLEQQAYDILHNFADQAFSFVDGTSFALMRHQRLTRAFAFDSHFATAGFTLIPGGKDRPTSKVQRPRSDY
jgi:predicted nucleic acid-binding protein